MPSPRVALISQDLKQSGGIKSVVRFMYSFCVEKGWSPTVLSYAPFKFHPDLSVSLLRPFSPFTPRVKALDQDGLRTILCGAYFPEFEPNRYRSNALWETLLNSFDMFLVLGGSAINGAVLIDRGLTYVTWVATSITDDRTLRLSPSAPDYRYQKWVLARLQKNETTVYSQSALNMLQSRYAEASLERLGGFTVPQRLLPYGIDTTHFAPLKNARRKGILFVGRFLDERKNIRLLLNAYAIACSKNPHLPGLRLAGAVPDRGLLTFVDHLGIASSIEWLGKLSMEALRDAYQHAEVFVLPSKQEGLGIALLESLSCATPVISTRCGGPERFLEHHETALLCDNHTPEALASMLLTFFDSPSLQAHLAEKGYDLVQTTFAKDTVYRDLMHSLRAVYPTII